MKDFHAQDTFYSHKKPEDAEALAAQKSALHIAVENNELDEVLFCLVDDKFPADITDGYGNTPLHIAAQLGYNHIVETLLKHHANVHAQNRWQATPLHYAVKWAINPYGPLNFQDESTGILHQNTVLNHIVIIRQLIDAGANVHEHGDFPQTTPLQLAIERNNTPVIKALLYRLIKNEYPDDALLRYLKKEPFHPDTIEGLLLIGAYMIAKTPSGQNAMDLALEHNAPIAIIRLLRRHGGKMTTTSECALVLRRAILSKKPMLPELMIFFEAGFNVNFLFRSQCSLLHFAIQTQQKDWVSQLIKWDANIFAQDNMDRTPLSLAHSMHLSIGTQQKFDPHKKQLSAKIISILEEKIGINDAIMHTFSPDPSVPKLKK